MFEAGGTRVFERWWGSWGAGRLETNNRGSKRGFPEEGAGKSQERERVRSEAYRGGHRR